MHNSTRTYSHLHALTLSCAHRCSHSQALALLQILTHEHLHECLHFACTHTHSHSHALTGTHSHACTPTHTHTHTRTHAHTHAHTLSYAYTCTNTQNIFTIICIMLVKPWENYSHWARLLILHTFTYTLTCKVTILGPNTNFSAEPLVTALSQLWMGFQPLLFFATL